MTEDQDKLAELTAEQKEQIRKNSRFEAMLFGCYTCCCMFVFSAVDIAAIIVANSEDVRCDKRGDFFVKPKLYLKVAGIFSLVFAAVTLTMHCLFTAESNASQYLNNELELNLASRRFYSAALLSSLFSIAWGIVGLRLFHRMTDNSCKSPGGMILAWSLIHFVTGVFPLLSICWGDSLLFVICEPKRQVPRQQQRHKSRRRDRNERVTYAKEQPRIVETAITPLARDEETETKMDIEAGGYTNDLNTIEDEEKGDLVVQTDIKEDDDQDTEDQVLLVTDPTENHVTENVDEDDGDRPSGVVPIESSPEAEDDPSQEE